MWKHKTTQQLQTHVLLLTSLPVCKAAKAATQKVTEERFSAFNKLAERVGGETLQPTRAHHKKTVSVCHLHNKSLTPTLVCSHSGCEPAET